MIETKESKERWEREHKLAASQLRNTPLEAKPVKGIAKVVVDKPEVVVDKKVVGSRHGSRHGKYANLEKRRARQRAYARKKRGTA